MEKYVIGLTGPMGCGKSAVAALLASYPNVVVHDTDHIAKKLMARPEHRAAIIAICGEGAFREDTLDRSAIAQVIFGDPAIRHALGAFVHPLVWREVAARIAASPARLQIIETALGFDGRVSPLVDAVIAVVCSEDVQRQRLREYRHMNDADITARLEHQPNARDVMISADYVVDTTCPLHEMLDRAEALYAWLLRQRKRVPLAAVYAGTFDPPTNGHLWMIRESARLFPQNLIVAVGINSDKKPWLSVEDRLELLREMTQDLPHVSVQEYRDQYLFDYIRTVGAGYIIRGIRTAGDFEYERLLRNANSALAGEEISSVFLMPPHELADVSSTFVRGLVGYAGWEKAVRKFVPEIVALKLKERFHG